MKEKATILDKIEKRELIQFGHVNYMTEKRWVNTVDTTTKEKTWQAKMQLKR